MCNKGPVSTFTHILRIQHKVLLYPALDFWVAMFEAILGVGTVDKSADTGSDGTTHTDIGRPLRAPMTTTTVEAVDRQGPVG